MTDSPWKCDKCKKPEIQKKDKYIIIGCPHYAVLISDELIKDNDE